MWPALIGAAGSLLGGFLNNNTQQSVNKQNIRAAAAAQQAAFARDDNKVQRLVADANAAGISPLAALGSSVSGTMASPVVPTIGGSSAMGDSVANAAAMIGDAFSRQQSDKLNLENQRLQNKLLETQIKEQQMGLAAARSRTVLSNLRTAGSDKHAITAFNGDQVLGSAKGSAYSDVAGEYGMTAGEMWGLAHLLDNVWNQNVTPVAEGINRAWRSGLANDQKKFLEITVGGKK